MQEAMQRPEVQAQMAQMQAMMRNEALQARLAELREDPEMKGVFEEIQKGGMGALMKWAGPAAGRTHGEREGRAALRGGPPGRYACAWS
jgi:hypothetical protein